MKWKKQLLEELPSIFSDKRAKTEKEKEDLEAELYRQIGQLKVENDRANESLIPVYRQCEFIGLPRSSYYYEERKEREYNLLLMRLIDEE